MEEDSALGKFKLKSVLLPFVVLTLIGIGVLSYSYVIKSEDSSDINILISPYQDLAMLTNLKHLNLEEKYGTSVTILTIPWEETYPTLLSATKTADMAFASYADFLTKKKNLNKGSDDPLLFILPAYIFKGGSFVSFNKEAPSFAIKSVDNSQQIEKFLRLRLGFPKATLYQMIVFYLAEKVGVMPKDVKFIDVGFDAGLLAAQAGDLDVTAVGLTQLTEAKNRGGTVILDMDQLGFADMTGFIVKKSILENKKAHVENVIRMWFDSVHYVLSDINNHSAVSLEYLNKHAATKYTLESYKAALAQEYFPTSFKELEKEILSKDGQFNSHRIHNYISGFLSSQGIIDPNPEPPLFSIPK